MATCKIGEFKFSLHMISIGSRVSNFLSYFFFLRILKAAPTKVEANRSSFCEDKSAKKNQMS